MADTFKDFLEEAVHPKDDLLTGITYEDLITAVQSNEKVVDKKSVMKVYNEIHNAAMKEALSELKRNMNWIISQAK